MMLVGAPPYEFPNPTNPAFRFIISGRLKDVLLHWKRLPLVPADALDVMEKIFKPEDQRISMQELRQHKYVGLARNVNALDEALNTKTNTSTQAETEKEIKTRMLTVKSEFIPSVQTEQAKDMAHKLRGTVGVENMRTFIKSVEQIIENSKNRSQSTHHTAENPKGEGVVHEDNTFHDDLCIDELRKLLQVAKDALGVNTA